MGRKRTKNLHLLPGVREIAGVWYWRPTSKRERDERKKLRDEAAKRGEKLTIDCTLGPAKSEAALKKWAEVSGYRDIEVQEGTMSELLTLWKRDGIAKRPDGRKRAVSTVPRYKAAADFLIEKFGTAKYGKTEFEASRGLAIGSAVIQQFVAEGGRAMENVYLAVLSNTFDHAIRVGRTTYNPCDKVVKNYMAPRTRAPFEWEVECLRALANRLWTLLIGYEEITGDRANEILAVQRKHCVAEGIRVHRKGDRWEVWEWTEKLREIVREAEKLPGANVIPLKVARLPYAERELHIFPSRRGGRFSYSGFNSAWVALVARTNKALAEAPVIDVETLEPTESVLRIEDLIFHDLRSKAHDDAEDKGRKGAKLIGDTEEVADRHYRRREKKRQPLG